MPAFQPVASHIIETLLIGACPERETEMRESWQQFQPEYYVKEDDEGAHISALRKRISWMHKTFAIDWMIAMIGIQAFKAYSPYILLAQACGASLSTNGLTDDDELAAIESQMDEVVYCAGLIRKAKELDDVEWPSTIPQPGACPDAATDPIGKATFDLACLSAAASFFHELRHVQFSVQRNAPAISVDEELACDRYSRTMLLDRVADYSKARGENEALVLNKRIMGLATLALCIANGELPGLASAVANSHPSVSERFQALVMEADAFENANCWVYTACLLMYLLRRANKLPSLVTFANAKNLCVQLVAHL